MGSINSKKYTWKTHELGRASFIKPEEELRRAVMTCMLWENQFYENGVDIADRIKDLCTRIDANIIEEITLEAKFCMKLRHAPLWLLVALAKKGKLRSELVYKIITRVDDMTELLALYWKDGKCPISKQLKKGLAAAFKKFSAYQLAKYNRDKAIKLKDVLFMVHAKPINQEQAEEWKQLIDGTLKPPDTWEVALSGGADKREAFTRLIKEGKLGGLAFLRNLRNMVEVGVDETLIKEYFSKIYFRKMLPFNFIAAAKHAPMYESEIQIAMLKCLGEYKKIDGNTIILIDVSGSMEVAISGKSKLDRLDAASGVAILAREICSDVRIFTFSESLVEVPARRGFALKDAIITSQQHGCTNLGGAVHGLNDNIDYDRIIIITDEQAHDNIVNPKAKGYIINVGSYERGVGYGQYIHINGWSESVINYIIEYENIDR